MNVATFCRQLKRAVADTPDQTAASTVIGASQDDFGAGCPFWHPVFQARLVLCGSCKPVTGAGETETAGRVRGRKGPQHIRLQTIRAVARLKH